jgi:hypothetical protein
MSLGMLVEDMGLLDVHVNSHDEMRHGVLTESQPWPGMLLPGDWYATRVPTRTLSAANADQQRCEMCEMLHHLRTMCREPIAPKPQHQTRGSLDARGGDYRGRPCEEACVGGLDHHQARDVVGRGSGKIEARSHRRDDMQRGVA